MAEGGGTASPWGGLEMVQRMRLEPFNLVTEQKLASHPFVVAAEEGRLTMAQRRAFACEQFSVQHSDALSFAVLAGHRDFAPRSLAGATAPRLPADVCKDTPAQPPNLFQFLLEGELYAAPLLLKHAQSLGLGDALSLAAYRTSAVAQAYPSYWARLALGSKGGAGAAACAVNFPAWGRMCHRLHAALASRQEYGYSGLDDDALGFIKFFSTPIDGLDEMAAKIIDSEGSTYEELLEPVRLLQEYEVMFWDAVLAAA